MKKLIALSMITMSFCVKAELKIERVVGEGVDEACARVITSGFEDGKTVYNSKLEDLDACKIVVQKKKNPRSAMILGSQLWEWGSYEEAVRIWESTPTKTCGVVAYLGDAYAEGTGALKNYLRAADYYRAASFNGCEMAVARNSLGVAYARGEGVKQDRVMAYALYLLAASGYSKEGKTNADRLEKLLSPEQINRGQSMALNWSKQDKR